MQLDDVRVIDPLQDPDLRQEADLQLLVQPLHHDLLDRHLRAMDPVPPVPDDGERSGSDLPPDYVVSDNPRSAARRLRHRRNPRNSEKKGQMPKLPLQTQLGGLRIQLWSRETEGVLGKKMSDGKMKGSDERKRDVSLFSS